jgi:hypothetical protein
MQKYSYLGYTYPNVSQPWKPIVMRFLRDVDRMVRPWHIPRIFLNIVNNLATGGSVVCVRNRFWLRVLEYFTKGVRFTDIKDKYATLRIYGSFTDEIQTLLDAAETECENTCEKCGSHDDVQFYGEHWVYCYCVKCREEAEVLKNIKNGCNNI